MAYILLSAAVLAAALCVYFFLRRRPHALFVLAYQKAGRAPRQSRLKDEWITPQAFEKTLLWLRANGFTTVSLQKLSEGKLPQKPVLLAFIGGYQSFVTDIFPLLGKYQMQAAVFIAPDLTGTYNAWQDPHAEPWQNLLTEKELKTLQKSGLVSLGALGLSAQDVTRLPEQDAAVAVRESLFRLKDQLGLKPEGFAFWPAEQFDPKQAASLLPDGFTAPLLTPRHGLNKRTGKRRLLKVFFPAKQPLAVRYLLWKHR